MQLVDLEISVKVFISYSHADLELCKKLEDHLSPLKYSGGDQSSTRIGGEHFYSVFPSTKTSACCSCLNFLDPCI